MTAKPLLGVTMATGVTANDRGASIRPWAPRRKARAIAAAETWIQNKGD